MSSKGPLRFDCELSELPSEPKKRHEEFVDSFGCFLFWHRNDSLRIARNFVEDEASRSKLGTIRRKPYEAVAQLPSEQREAAMALVEESLNCFAQLLAWSLGDEGTDARFGTRHAYRYRVEMEIVDVETGEIVEEHPVNRGGKFFGDYWGRWLNRYGSKK